FYTKYLDFNKRAIRLSKEVSLPLVGNSDTHFLFQFNTTYSFIDSKKDIGSILEAIKKGNLKVQTTPLTLLTFSRMIFNCFSPIKI
ncbi:MAG: PHP-associated domain-containing protein, partial [Nanoarchaeota archaeon]